MDSATIEKGMTFIQQIGVMGSIALGLVVCQIIYAWNVKRNAVEPTIQQQKDIEKMQVNIDKLWLKNDIHAQQIQDFKLELERRLTRVWAEEKLIPRLDWLNNEFIQFKSEVSTRLSGIETQIKNKN